MQTYLYRGYIIKYEHRDGKVVVSEYIYGSETHHPDQTFASIRAMQQFIDNGGWEPEA